MEFYSNFRSKIKTTQWKEEQEATLLEPYTYISANPGKEVRTKLIEAFNVWLKVPEEDLEVIRKVVRLLHNASLLMDDVEDNSELRRGIPVAHVIYGVPQTINTANYVYFQAMRDLLALRGRGEGKGKGKERDVDEDVVRVVTEELLNLHRGQGLDLFWRDSLSCPTEEEYVQMVLGKTGGLFRIAVKLMMAQSESEAMEADNRDYVPLVNLISVFFQIRDDYMNLQSTEYADNKGFAEDLTEGKFSFPVVHGVRADPSNRQILNVLQKRTTIYALKKHTVDYLQQHTNSFAYTREVLQTLHQQIEDEIKELGGNRALEAILGLLGVPEANK